MVKHGTNDTRLSIGIIGGTGLYELDGLKDVERVDLQTPFGAPSGPFVTGRLFEKRVVFLPRHGRGHRILPSDINYRANIWGMKKLGVSQLISVSAVGSMKEAIVPGHLVLVDQFIDLTKRRASTFFGDGIVAHVPMADPVCHKMRALLLQTTEKLGFVAHPRGTYVCIEGPQFSTRAESMVYRSWGVDVIGMTNMPEAKLAREAEIAYATIALATDYDCWHASEESVSVEAILAMLRSNAQKAKDVIAAYVKEATETTASPECLTATRTNLVTPIGEIPESVRQTLSPILAPILSSTQE